jgi:two-component system, NarL family, sensor kinase
VLGAWIKTWFWYPLVAMVTLFTILLFPSGLPSRRWRPVLWASVLAVGVIRVMAALSPTLEAGGRSVPNPIGVTVVEVSDVEDTLVFQVATSLLTIGIGASVLSLVLRFRRSRGEEPQQLKWFVYKAMVLTLTFGAPLRLRGRVERPHQQGWGRDVDEGSGGCRLGGVS